MSRIRRNKTILILVVFVLIFYLSIRSLSAIFKLNTSKENNLQPQVRVYCFILTAPKFFGTRALAINSTWARRCDGYSFISEYSNDTKGLPIAPIRNLSSSYDYLTQKSTSALLYIYENFLNDYDWFFKADDDTYLFVENLKFFLKDKNASEPITFGYNFKVIVEKGYHSGGGGYVLSREAVKRFYQAHQNPNTTCRKDGRGAEDAEIAKCLRSVDVYPGKSIDNNNRERFHALAFGDHYMGGLPDWMYKNSENEPLAGSRCCSNTTITFHYITPELQYLIDKVRYGFND